jgi:hypothetical protein
MRSIKLILDELDAALILGVMLHAMKLSKNKDHQKYDSIIRSLADQMHAQGIPSDEMTEIRERRRAGSDEDYEL